MKISKNISSRMIELLGSLCVFVVLIGSTQALAFPTKGYWIPRTRTLSFDEIKFDLQVKQGPEKGKPNQNASAIGVEAGFVEWNHIYVEAGGDWVEPTHEDILLGITGNGKVAYQSLSSDGWSIAVGVEDFAVREGQHDNNVIYTIAEAAIGTDWIVAMGGFSGKEERIKTSSGFMFGLWRKIQLGAGDVGLEWMSGQGKFGYIVPGIRAQVRDGFEATLAYAFSSDPNTYRNLFLTRLTVYF